MKAMEMIKSGKKWEIMQRRGQGLGMLFDMSQIYDIKDSIKFIVQEQYLSLKNHRALNTYIL